MIHPNMATMLAFVTCDAAVSTSLWQEMLSRAADKSFNQITVDGDTSTNDTLIALANGQSRTPAITEMGADAEKLEAMLTEVCQYLARAIARDGEGALWFVTAHEASRLRPVAERQDASLPVFISGVRIAGIPMEISALGEAVVAAREFRARDTSLSIDFIALGFGAGDLPRYQYRLEGADREWSAPTEQRTVNYGGLTPGQYRFQVRAVTAAGTVSDPPAEVRFFLPRPVWQRWWFLALLSAITTAALYVAYRYRLAQLLQLERVRTRIASDLHDDIGANLTKISILSEVAKQQHGAGGENGLHPLTSIADLSRESVAAMSDIVWAINPRKDNLLDLVRRMRQHAEETLDAAGIALRFTVPEAGADLKLGADLRRQIYLIFKEALNNLVRHAHASRAAIALQPLTLRSSASPSPASAKST